MIVYLPIISQTEINITLFYFYILDACREQFVLQQARVGETVLAAVDRCLLCFPRLAG